MPTEFSLPSFAKINWYLRILGKRPDGYHELCTLFQTISLHDTLHFAESDTLELTCNDPAVPTDDSNLIIQAANALSRMTGKTKGAKIHLEKRIPSPGGLGGGSSNAYVAIIGLIRLWRVLMLDGDLAIAKRLGSDVAFFGFGGTAIGTGRGEIIERTDEREEQHMLIVTPDIKVSTTEAFEQNRAESLTNERQNHILSVCRIEAKYWNIRRSSMNDFEAAVFRMYPEIARVKKVLLELGAVNAAMSGSGASVFAIFDKEETRQAALKALEIESNWRRFAVATVTREEYRKALQMTS